jgi:methylthioribose-1-phosphate isomerase
VPGRDFAEFLGKHYPHRKWGLLTAESRPHEPELAKRLETFSAGDYETVVITDNMVGFCLLKKRVEAVFLFYRQITDDEALCQGGSLLTAVLAQEVAIPCSLYPTDFDPETARIPGDLSFAGDALATGGVKSYVPRVDRVPMSYISKVW